jgi:acyl-CoA thioester hydrolase
MSEHTTARPKKPISKPTPRLEQFPHRAADIVRFADLDPQGHVNNAVFATYFETGRVAMFRDRNLGIGVENATYVLVRQEIDFLRELRWPGDVVIGTALAELGRSSFTVAQAVFSGEVCAAAGRATLVMLDATTRRPRPLPPEAIARLEQWTYRGA